MKKLNILISSAILVVGANVYPASLSEEQEQAVQDAMDAYFEEDVEKFNDIIGEPGSPDDSGCLSALGNINFTLGFPSLSDAAMTGFNSALDALMGVCEGLVGNTTNAAADLNSGVNGLISGAATAIDPNATIDNNAVSFTSGDVANAVKDANADGEDVTVTENDQNFSSALEDAPSPFFVDE